MKAIKKGETKKVKKILPSEEFDLEFLAPGENDYDENGRPLWDDEDEYGFTLLILACSSGKLEVVELLVEAGIDIKQGRYVSTDSSRSKN